eukprot:11162515-Lingulodinium_polyedra.AAC.1
MAVLDPGTRAYVQYDGFPLWHERLVAAWVDQADYVVVTPDLDIFVETLGLHSPDLQGFRVPVPGALQGIPGGSCTGSRPSAPPTSSTSARRELAWRRWS